MKYTYAYKTSDGKRHEASMDAKSREDVFAALRAQGIKAIKVVAADGSKANGEVRGVQKRAVVVVVLTASLIAAVCAYYIGTRETSESNEKVNFSSYSTKEKTAYLKLSSDVENSIKALVDDSTETEMNRRLTKDFETTATSISPLYSLVDSRASAIVGARKEIRRAFATAASAFSPDGLAMRDIQRLYGVRMSQLDALEIANANRRLALDILDKNRGKWKSGKNGPEFTDDRLAKMYNYCLEGLSTDATTSRWQRDFGMGGATD